MSRDYDEEGNAIVERLLSTEQERQAKAGPPPARVLPANWGTKSRGGDAWLDSERKVRTISKERGALWASLGLVDDALIADREE